MFSSIRNARAPCTGGCVDWPCIIWLDLQRLVEISGSNAIHLCWTCPERDLDYPRNRFYGRPLPPSQGNGKFCRIYYCRRRYVRVHIPGGLLYTFGRGGWMNKGDLFHIETQAFQSISLSRLSCRVLIKSYLPEQAPAKPNPPSMYTIDIWTANRMLLNSLDQTLGSGHWGR